MSKGGRMGRETYYLTILQAVSKRSTCDRGRSGAILVKQGRVISAGYVGAPCGMPHCDEVGHLLQKRRITQGIDREGLHDHKYTHHCIRTVHAELNAILQAAVFGISVEGAIMYCTMMPCYECAKAIVNARLLGVVALYPYQDQKETIKLFEKAGMGYNIINPGAKAYEQSNP